MNARMRAEEFSWASYHRRIARLFSESLGSTLDVVETNP